MPNSGEAVPVISLQNCIWANLKTLPLHSKFMLALAGFAFGMLTFLRISLPIAFSLLVTKVASGTASWFLYGLVYAALFLVTRVFEEVRFVSYTVFEQFFQKSVSLSLLRNFFSLNFSDATRHTPSELAILIDRGLTGLREVGFNSVFFLGPLSLEVLVITFLIWIYVDGGTALLGLFLILLFVSITYKISSKIQKLQKVWFTTAARNYKILSETIRAFETLRSFSATEWAIERSSQASDVFIKEVIISLKPGVLLAFLQGTLLFLLMGLSSLMILVTVPETSHRVSTLILINGLLLQISSPLTQFSYAYRGFIQGLASVRQMLSAFTLSPMSLKITHHPAPDSAVISVHDLQIHYRDGTKIVSENIEIPNKGLVSIGGASGSGKTSFAKALAGLQTYQGLIQLKFAPQSIYFSSQLVDVFDLPIKENILLGKPYDAEKFNFALRDAGFTPEEIEHIGCRSLGEQGTALSGGQRKRLGIARMLYHDAELLIVDEPTSELDGVAASLVRETLLRLAKDKCVILATHDQEIIKVSQYRISASGGKICRPSPPRDSHSFSPP